MPRIEKKIIVITPVRNEAWILKRFLQVTSSFADLIIIADQGSTDGSREIYREFPKVHFVDNVSADFNEAERQQLLIKVARQIVPGPRLLLALDADEILAADATSTPGWQAMLDAEPGTVLCFEKPDLYLTPDACIRYDLPWPLGYVDDGEEHFPKIIHSIRIPMPLNARMLLIHDVKIIHYGLIRTRAQRAKMRMYSVVENALGKGRSVFGRRIRYNASVRYEKGHRLEPTPIRWLEGWEKTGIDMRTIQVSEFYWYDFDVLRHFTKHGIYKFWLEDIWDIDWERCRLAAIERGEQGILVSKVSPPPSAVKGVAVVITELVRMLRFLRNKVLRHGKKWASWG